MYYVFEDLLSKSGAKAVEVSRATDIPQSTFSDWKKGKSSPKKDKLDRIANFFKVDVRIFNDTQEIGHCLDCGMDYSPTFSDEVERHDINHVKWQNAVKYFGFCWSYNVRENAKTLARNKIKRDDITINDMIECQEDIFKSLFSRSVEASDYDLHHVGFDIYVSMLLNQNYFRESIDPDIYGLLVKKYGISDGIEEGKTHYNVSYQKPQTIAAHRDNEIEWTLEELQKIEDYKRLLIAARNGKK